MMASKHPVYETPFESYTAGEVLGEGGAGRVYKAVGTKQDIVAIKCLAAERITAERLKRFKNEIEFCQRMGHANIIRVIDTGVIYIKNVKCPFYVMPLHSGTLRTVMASLTPDKVLSLYSQILDGVEAAHLLGVWHRDIKPENILWNDATKQLVVADFGIAHFEEDEIYTAVETKDAARMANFQYSAPEQRVRGKSVDLRADIFSLGLILNELFTHNIPQGAGYKHIKEVSSEHGYLDEIVNSMIQQDQGNRPNNIQEVKKELIGRKNSFVAMQRLDKLKGDVVKESEPPSFDSVSINGLDYENGTLVLNLSRSVPPEWAQAFQQPGTHAYIQGYGPEKFQISGNKVSISVRGDEDLLQRLVNHAKDYVSSANVIYRNLLLQHANQEERRRRKEHEKKVAEAELRKTLLSSVKL